MRWKNALSESRLFIGLEHNRTSHSEKLISGLGAVVGIAAALLITHLVYESGTIDINTHYLVVASMGASAVLVFAVPHGVLSQPWSVVAGHLLSGFIGVTCYQLLGASTLASALAVGLSVTGMYYFRCIHPPGGATALAAVIGGEQVYSLGYEFLLSPILINVLTIILVAILFNGFFAWRRYPAHMGKRPNLNKSAQAADRQFELTQEDFSAAIEELDSYVDITTEGLTNLLELAKRHAEKNITHPTEIKAGKFYSNGKLGRLWSVRQIIDAPSAQRPHKDQVIYKVVAGDQSYATNLCLRSEFKLWARFEVELINQRWIKVAEESI